jgi:hypothetical protein
VDWLNLHISTLDSEDFLGCEPVDQATWLKLSRYCIGQENGGTIKTSPDWGDRRWQQVFRVTFKEARRACSLWHWDGDDLVVHFYPADKESEVKAKRELARTNGQRGGRPRKTYAGSENETNKKPTSVNSPKAEGNGKEGNGKEVSAAAPPHAQETDAAAADPMSEAFEAVEKANPAPRRALPPLSFADWRIQVGKRIFWTRDEDDTWRAMFEAEGWDEMTRGYEYLASKHPAPKKLFLSMFQELRA